MKTSIIFYFLLISLYASAQTNTIVSTNKSVIALDKVKTVYRGIANPISIAVSDCKSFKVEGIGLEEVSKGKYTLSPGAGTETKILVTITNLDDSISIEEHSFTIRNITNAITTINGSYCTSCTLLFDKEDLKDAFIGVSFRDLNLDYEAEVVKFTVKFPKENSIEVNANQITEEVYKRLKKNQLIVISEIKTKFEGLGNTLICRIPPIFIKVN